MEHGLRLRIDTDSNVSAPNVSKTEIVRRAQSKVRPHPSYPLQLAGHQLCMLRLNPPSEDSQEPGWAFLRQFSRHSSDDSKTCLNNGVLLGHPRPGKQNATATRAPRPLSPGKMCSSPPICFTSDSTIFIPSPLLQAGLNPIGNPGPLSDTDSE